MKEQEADETKVGARNNRMDKTTIQEMHDASVMLGAMCEAKPMKDLEQETLVGFGDTVKALGNGKVGGYLVRHSGEADPDLTADFFDAKTEIHAPDALPVLYQHGFDERMGKKVLGRAKTGRDDVGMWIEAQLDMRDEYEKAIYALAEKGKLGWSSGALSHLVEREPAGKAMHIKTWFIGEASLTPTPAEPRNSVVPLKSITLKAAMPGAEPESEVSNAAQPAKENFEMELNEFKTLLEDSNKALVATIEEKATAAAKAAVTEALDALPEVKASMNGSVQVTRDEADVPFKSVGENLQAIAGYVRDGRQAPRMKALHALNVKANLGSNETVPSQGQFLLEPTLVADFLKPVHEEGPFTSRVKPMPVSGNSNFGWINGVDETSRATGSRWGGVRGYWLSEGDTITASQPKFRRINWELHKLAVLQYASDELLADTGLLNSIIAQSAAEELSFMCNDAILRGSGAGQCLGILNSGAVISAVRTNATNIDHDDILRMVARTNSRQFANSVWFANPDIAPEIDSLNFTAGSTGILSPYVTYAADGVTMLRGRPVIYNEFSPTLGSVGDLLLADMTDYLFWEKGGVQAAASIHVQFLTDQTAFRFIFRCDGQPATYTARTRYQSTDTESPYIALAATT